MIIDRSIRVAAPADETFRRCLDIPFVGACLPGAQDVTPDGDGSYRGRFEIKVGPVAVRLGGTVTLVESDERARTAVLRLHGSDRRIGGEVTGEMRIAVSEIAPDSGSATGDAATESHLDVHTDVAVTGKLGQFGQAVMAKKADQITEAFVQEFSRRLTEPTVTAPPARPAPPLPDTAPASVPSVAPTGPAPGVDPYALTALLRPSRRIELVGSAEPAERRRSGPYWLADGARDPGDGPRVVELAVADEAELLARLPRSPHAGAAAPLVALTPRGAAVGDVARQARLGAMAAGRGHPVLLVATTPWTALSCARAAADIRAQGVALLFRGATSGVTDLLALAHAEIRAAGLRLPVLLGPVPDDRRAATLLAAGPVGSDGGDDTADGVIVRQSGKRPGRGWLRGHRT